FLRSQYDSGKRSLEQVRSAINTENESFKALTQSINEKGVLEPILVTPSRCDASYTLLCGERRYHGTYKAGLEIIPARIVNAVTQKDEILAFIQAKHPDKNYNLDGAMSELVPYAEIARQLGVSPVAVSKMMKKKNKS
ncbi:MAG: hypothetical protein C0392_16375, partial [Syntrophus sp. (in: bacteria)]|nr:hypothetical protein [Syntrophus sp. (in: bacteria)]